MEPGAQFGHYEITAPLGKGGMGEVWRARDTKLGREVAIKVLPSEFARDEERLARFEREARMLAALNHPNIAAIHGLEESDDTRFLVLELVEGDTLADRLGRGAIPVEESLRLALQITTALEAAHEKGVVHRDLKPANIKITPEGRVKVLDFGLAKAFVGDRLEGNLSNSPTLSIEATQAGIILGTAAYMSPEQAKGRTVDRRADVWGFGCVLYEMLAGRPTFAGEDVSTVLARVLEREPDYGALPGSLHLRVRELLERCLEKDPANRYRDIGDVRVDLQRILADPGGAAIPAAAWPAAPSRRSWVAAAALAVVVAASAWFLKPAPPVSRPVVRSVISPVERPPLPAPGRTVAISPDGRRVVYVVLEGGATALYLRHLDELGGAVVRGSEEALDPFFSTDGASIGFTSTSSLSLERVPAGGGQTTSLAQIATPPRGAIWGPSDTVVFARANIGLQRVAGMGGEAETLTELGTAAGHLWPEVLPAGDAVVFTIVSGAGSENHEVAVIDLETRELEILIPGASHARYAASGHLVYAVEDTLWAVRFDPDARSVLSQPVPVLEGVAMNPNSGLSEFDISDDGSLVYITSTGGFASGGVVRGPPDLNLTIFDRQGNQRTLGTPPRPYRHPRVSPDGRQVAVEITDGTESAVWVYDIGGGAAIRRLTQVTEGNNIRPIWTPDGERVTFASDRDGPFSIYWQPADGSGPAERLTTAEEGTVHRPETWSPDGVLAFELRTGDLAGLVGHPATGELWTLTTDGEMGLFYDLPERNQFGAAFSPDGRWLAYTSAETLPAAPAAFRIFVGAWPGNVPRYEIVGNGASWPVWSPDGRELFYRPSTVVGTTTLNSVAIRTDPAFSFTTEENLIARGFNIVTDYRDYDPLPDGTGFVMLTAADAPEPASLAVEPGPDAEVVLVQNFFEVLTQLLPAR